MVEGGTPSLRPGTGERDGLLERCREGAGGELQVAIDVQRAGCGVGGTRAVDDEVEEGAGTVDGMRTGGTIEEHCGRTCNEVSCACGKPGTRDGDDGVVRAIIGGIEQTMDEEATRADEEVMTREDESVSGADSEFVDAQGAGEGDGVGSHSHLDRPQPGVRLILEDEVPLECEKTCVEDRAIYRTVCNAEIFCNAHILAVLAEGACREREGATDVHGILESPGAPCTIEDDAGEAASVARDVLGGSGVEGDGAAGAEGSSRGIPGTTDSDRIGIGLEGSIHINVIDGDGASRLESIAGPEEELPVVCDGDCGRACRGENSGNIAVSVVICNGDVGVGDDCRA